MDIDSVPINVKLISIMRYRLLHILFLLPLAALISFGVCSETAIRQLDIASSINPVTASFIGDQIAEANNSGEAAVLIQLDTPGGWTQPCATLSSRF